MPVNRASIGGSPYLGVYFRVGEKVAVVPPSVPDPLSRSLERMFQVPVLRSTIADAEIVGSLVAFNSFGAIVAAEIDARERRCLESFTTVTVVETRQNALGNNVLANDRGAVVHPGFTEEDSAAIGIGLGVPVRRGTVAGLGTVGMAAVATNRGVVVHPKTTDREATLISEVLGVRVHRSTANFGVPIVGACLIANSRALLVGTPTTPVELVHLQEGLQILD